jgi:hypothetical protein
MRLLKLFVACFLLGTSLVACTGVQIEVVPDTPVAAQPTTAMAGGTPTEAAMDSTATPTSIATLADAATATPSPTFTVMPTSTNTPVPTAAPAPTAGPTSQATAVKKVNTLGLPGPVLDLADLPQGFEELDLAQMGVTVESLRSSPFPVQSAFAFLQPQTSEVVMGGTVSLSNAFERIGFDVLLNSPNLIVNLAFSNDTGQVKIVEQAALPINRVGENSAGLTLLLDVNGTLMRANMVGFRQGAYGAFVGTIYPEKAESAVSLESLAQTLAGKLK